MLFTQSEEALHPQRDTGVEAVSLHHLHLLLDHLKGIVGYFDTENRCVYANHAYAQAYHTTVELMIGKHIREVIGEDGWHFVEPYARRVLSGEAVKYVREIDQHLPTSHWIEVHLVPNAAADGRIVGNFVFVDDVTAQHQSEEAYRASEARTQRFIAAGTEGIVFYQNGVVLDCNDAFTRMLGKSREELMGSDASELFLKRDRDYAVRHMHLERDTVYSASLPKLDGGVIEVEISSRRVVIDGSTAFVAVVRDTTQMVKMNDALARSQLRYRSLVDNSDQCAFFTQDRKVIYANPAAVQLFGSGVHDLIGVESLYLIHPDDRTYALRRRKELIAGDINTEVVLRAIAPASEQIDQHTRVVWVRLHGSIIEWQGRPGVLIFLTDITALRESEEMARKALAQERELGDLKTRFVSMASHEFRTPLATIQTSSELLQHYSDRLSAEERSDTLNDIQRAVQRMQMMMDRFLAFGRMDAGSTVFAPVATSVLGCLNDLLRETRAASSASHQVAIQCQAPLSTQTQLMLDQALLGQMFMNLIANACKYSLTGTVVNVTVSKEISAHGERLRIAVKDHGIGIPESELPRLFDSFYRASNAISLPGTGLGLAIVDRAARAHSGNVEVKSALGEGSEFILCLPWVEPT